MCHKFQQIYQPEWIANLLNKKLSKTCIIVLKFIFEDGKCKEVQSVTPQQKMRSFSLQGLVSSNSKDPSCENIDTFQICSTPAIAKRPIAKIIRSHLLSAKCSSLLLCCSKTIFMELTALLRYRCLLFQSFKHRYRLHQIYKREVEYCRIRCYNDTKISPIIYLDKVIYWRKFGIIITSYSAAFGFSFFLV